MINNSTIYGNILHKARDSRSNHGIHAYYNAPYRAKRVSVKVAWGVHIHRCQRKYDPTLICTKCQSPLTNKHILGGCIFTTKLRAKRHTNTFTLLHQLLQRSNGGRYPILRVDLGNKPVTDFANLKADANAASHTHLQGIAHSKQEGP